MASAITTLILFLSLLNIGLTGKVPDVEYDVIVIGGGPGGLSATSALSRVARKVIMFDDERYRNGPTRHMHDVIGNDGTVPADFRTAARQQIAKYGTATMKKATVVDITHIRSPDGFDWFVARDDAGLPYTARRVILATGVTDLLPSTKGVADAFGKGMYWCPWCDGYEHREQSLAVLGPLSDALSAALEMHNMNPDIIVMTNGTDTPEQRKIATERSSTWEAQFAAYNISVVNTTIESITRLRDGKGNPVRPQGIRSRISPQTQYEILGEDVGIDDDRSGPNGKHKDLFRVKFTDGLSIERSAFLINIEVRPTSDLAVQLRLEMKGPKISVDAKMQTNQTGIFAVGDANTDGSTNVPHAMYTGKKAAVVAHVQLAKEESLASISKRAATNENGMTMTPENRENIVLREIGDDLETLWDAMQK